MNKRNLLAAIVALFMAGSAQAWRPAGWSWWAWPYAYDLQSGDWYWLNTGNAQWVYALPPENAWKKLVDSGLAADWTYFAWPYAYDWEAMGWSYINESDTQWCVNLRTGEWALFGRLSITPPPPTLVATNILGSDGSISRINVGSPPPRLVISSIVGLATSDDSAPGSYLIGIGPNTIPDVTIFDRFFQSGGNLVVDDTGTYSDNSSSSPATWLALLEADHGGLTGTDPIEWHFTLFSNAVAHTMSSATGFVSQTGSTFLVNGVRFRSSGLIANGDKCVINNSGIHNRTLWASVDVNGDGDLSMGLNHTTSNSTNWNHSTLRFHCWEIREGSFVSGSFDVTLNVPLPSGNTWPGGDSFDVISIAGPLP